MRERLVSKERLCPVPQRVIIIDDDEMIPLSWGKVFVSINGVKYIPLYESSAQIRDFTKKQSDETIAETSLIIVDQFAKAGKDYIDAANELVYIVKSKNPSCLVLERGLDDETQMYPDSDGFIDLMSLSIDDYIKSRNLSNIDRSNINFSDLLNYIAFNLIREFILAKQYDVNRRQIINERKVLEDYNKVLSRLSEEILVYFDINKVKNVFTIANLDDKCEIVHLLAMIAGHTRLGRGIEFISLVVTRLSNILQKYQ